VSEIAKRNARNRGAGKRWEREIRDGGRAEGIDTEHTRDTGTKDEGDLVLRVGGRFHVVEAKNAKLAPTEFLREAAVEAEHFAEARKLPGEVVHPVVFVKRARFGFLDGLALLTVRDYLKLAKAAGS
jgi:hypothetical protein